VQAKADMAQLKNIAGSAGRKMSSFLNGYEIKRIAEAGICTTTSLTIGFLLQGSGQWGQHSLVPNTWFISDSGECLWCPSGNDGVR
jgi:hypothetical protein